MERRGGGVESPDSEALVEWCGVEISEVAHGSIRVILEIQDGLQIKRSEWEGLPTLLRECSENEVVLRVVRPLDVEVVLDEIKEDSLHLVDLNHIKLGEGLREVLILK